MRVIAARPTDGRNASTDRTRLVRAIAVSTVSLALVDPEAARTVLEQLESRAGFDLAAEWSTREPWLIAWALVDLQKARAVFEAELASLDRQKEVNLWGTGFFEMVELLTAPPDRREEVLDQRPAEHPGGRAGSSEGVLGGAAPPARVGRFTGRSGARGSRGSRTRPA